ncbi:hypothetical protein FZ103_00275 [Streptomonospora sp. PA3]|uniref:hypothetical protein n=1 Tax=Streptomonospora sp. PA3 TaxID=2607326 RepID=UPI001308867C|nr:hypothetical protein [Streptomonospora sp. PA3]MUL39629.1 hypothetical protein [Streptomonospora sp. PA3]
MAYATTEELTAYLGTAPDGAQRMLDRATRLVDQALISARYDPADPDVIDALRSATLEQCAEWDEAGSDGTQASDPSAWQTVSAGSISMSRAGGRTGERLSVTQHLGHQAWLVLQQAGLTGHAPRSGWC